MVNTKLVSIKRIIAKVYSDLGITEENVPVTDIIEWSAEALEKIEAPTILNTKVTGKEGIELIPVVNYQASLPLDCVQVLQVAYSDTKTANRFYPMVYNSGSFSGRHGLTSEMTNENYTPTNDEVVGDYELINLTMELYELTYSEALEKLNNDADLKSTLTSLLSDEKVIEENDSWTVDVSQLEYKIVPGYIKTNVKSGYLMISYTAIPTDEDGYPMIPDHPSFIDAVFWYVNMKISYIKYRTNPTNATKSLYDDAAREWRFYVKQAYGKAMMPANVDELESIKNQWVRLIPKINEHDTFFNNINNQEYIKNHTSVNYHG